MSGKQQTVKRTMKSKTYKTQAKSKREKRERLNEIRIFRQGLQRWLSSAEKYYRRVGDKASADVAQEYFFFVEVCSVPELQYVTEFWQSDGTDQNDYAALLARL